MLSTLQRNVMVYSEPVDMRRSYDGLHALIRDRSPLSGTVFLFVAKNRKRAKALFFDGTGWNIWMKRLEKGVFADVFRRSAITQSELKLFFEGSQHLRKSVAPDDLSHRYQERRIAARI